VKVCVNLTRGRRHRRVRAERPRDRVIVGCTIVTSALLDVDRVGLRDENARATSVGRPDAPSNASTRSGLDEVVVEAGQRHDRVGNGRPVMSP